MNIFVTGGAGYIGSHTVDLLNKSNVDVTVFDNLVYGHSKSIKGTRLIIGDLLNYNEIHDALKERKYDAVVHFAAYASVGESVKDPYKYFQNNVYGTLNLLKAMVECEVTNLVFSSTCAIFGTPKELPLSEDLEKHPESPYGESKLMVENILAWYDRIYNLRSVALRYFNACGSSLDGTIGEDVRPPIRIIPNIMDTVLGKKPYFTLNGTDFPTPDGTCVRDYVHVLDLAAAHLLALEYLEKEKKSDQFNLGSEKGSSNREIIGMVKEVTGCDFKVVEGPRRAGDPVALYADSGKAKRVLKWNPKYSDLKTIVGTSWLWSKTHPYGYPS